MIVRYIQYITSVIACRRIDYEEHTLTLMTAHSSRIAPVSTVDIIPY